MLIFFFLIWVGPQHYTYSYEINTTVNISSSTFSAHLFPYEVFPSSMDMLLFVNAATSAIVGFNVTIVPNTPAASACIEQGMFVKVSYPVKSSLRCYFTLKGNGTRSLEWECDDNEDSHYEKIMSSNHTIPAFRSVTLESNFSRDNIDPTKTQRPYLCEDVKITWFLMMYFSDFFAKTGEYYRLADFKFSYSKSSAECNHNYGIMKRNIATVTRDDVNSFFDRYWKKRNRNDTAFWIGAQFTPSGWQWEGSNEPVPTSYWSPNASSTLQYNASQPYCLAWANKYWIPLLCSEEHYAICTVTVIGNSPHYGTITTVQKVGPPGPIPITSDIPNENPGNRIRTRWMNTTANSTSPSLLWVRERKTTSKCSLERPNGEQESLYDIQDLNIVNADDTIQRIGGSDQNLCLTCKDNLWRWTCGVLEGMEAVYTNWALNQPSLCNNQVVLNGTDGTWYTVEHAPVNGEKLCRLTPKPTATAPIAYLRGIVRMNTGPTPAFQSTPTAAKPSRTRIPNSVHTTSQILSLFTVVTDLVSFPSGAAHVSSSSRYVVLNNSPVLQCSLMYDLDGEISLHPTQVPIAGSLVYGSIVMNLLIVILVGCIQYCVITYAVKTPTPAEGRFPALSYLVWEYFMPILLASCAFLSMQNLARNGEQTFGGIIFVLIVVLHCTFLYVVATMWAPQWTEFQLKQTVNFSQRLRSPKHAAAATKHAQEGQEKEKNTSFITTFFPPQGQWIDTVKTVPFLKQYGTVFNKYRRDTLWFVYLEFFETILVALVTGYPIQSDRDCLGLSIFKSISTALYGLAMAYFKPYRSKVKLVTNLLISLLTFLAMACAGGGNGDAAEYLMCLISIVAFVAAVHVLYLRFFRQAIRTRLSPTNSAIMDDDVIPVAEMCTSPSLFYEGESDLKLSMRDRAYSSGGSYNNGEGGAEIPPTMSPLRRHVSQTFSSGCSPPSGIGGAAQKKADTRQRTTTTTGSSSTSSSKSLEENLL
eukprot:PhF_6_TR37118/c0_g1_i3/m.54552